MFIIIIAKIKPFEVLTTKLECDVMVVMEEANPESSLDGIRSPRARVFKSFTEASGHFADMIKSDSSLKDSQPIFLNIITKETL